MALITYLFKTNRYRNEVKEVWPGKERLEERKKKMEETRKRKGIYNSRFCLNLKRRNDTSGRHFLPEEEG